MRSSTPALRSSNPNVTKLLSTWRRSILSAAPSIRRMPPIPEQMRALPRDPRGYPIPVTIGRDQNGKPHFVVNDEAERQRVIAHALCSICGERMSRVRWFVGGPQSAFHEHGAYIDPPMHKDCAHFALQCCPYLAMPSYRGFADTQKVADRFNNGPLMVNTMMPGRPPVFVAVRSDGVEIKSW